MDILILAGENLLLSVVIAWVFYNAWWGLLSVVPASVLNTRRYKRSRQEAYEKKFTLEYKELLTGLVASLETGYSIENAFKDAEKNLLGLFGEKGVLYPELTRMNAKVALHVPVEAAFAELAERHPYEEVLGFSNIFVFAKRLGGDYIKNLRKSAAKIEEKIDLKQEIAATIAEKHLELKVMSVMPAAIIGYVKVGSPEFLEPMYGNIGGACAMTVCLCLYAAAVMLGRKMVDIRI